MVDQPHGDLTEINTSRLILDSVGPKTLAEVADDYLDLLGTFVAVYEKNGDYALNTFAPGWCRLLSGASRRLCRTQDDRQALESGKWLCRESCWNDCARQAMDSGEPVDSACAGGLRFYGMPITAGQELVGAIVIGYGDPPSDKAGLKKIAKNYGLKLKDLEQEAKTHPSHSPEVVGQVRKRLATTARLIGALVEAKQAARNLRESEERFRLLFDGSESLISVYDRQGICLLMNQRVAQLFGGSPEQFMGKSFSQLHPSVGEEYSRRIAKVIDSGQPSEYEDLVSFPNGPRWLLSILQPLRDAAGRVYAAQIVSHDMTERKLAEEELARREETLRGIYNTVQAGIILVDDQGVITMANPRMAQMLGVGQEELVGSAYLDYIAEGHDQEAGQKMHQLMAGEVGQVSHERLYRRADGGTFWGFLSGQRLHHPDGSFWTLVGVIQDITKRKLAEEAIRQSETRFRQLVENINSVFWVGSPDWKEVHYVSPVYERVWGRSRESLYRDGLSWLEPLPAEDRQEIENFMRTTDPNQPTEFPIYRVVRGDGEIRWLAVRSFPVLDDQDQVSMICGIADDITDRIKIEQELRQALNRLTSHLGNSPLGVVEFDREYRIIYWSPQAESIFGWKADEVMGKTLSNIRFIHQEDEPQVSQLIANMMAGKSKSNTNFNRNYKKDGTVIDCAWYNSALLDDNGQLISVFCSVLDITERKKAEQSLKDSEERYRQLFSSMLSGFALHEIITDDQGQPVDYRFLEVNPAFEQLTGLKAADILGRTVRQVLPDTEEHWIETYGRVALGGEPKRFENYSQPLDRHFEVLAYSPAPGQFAVIFQDITERKKAEEAIRQSEEKFRSAFDNAGIGMALVGVDSRFLSVNEALTEMLGYSPEELKELTFVDITHPEDLESAKLASQRLGKGEVETYEQEKRYLRKDGATIWVRINGNLLRDGQGQPLFMVSQVADITERKKAQDELNEIFNMSMDLICVADIKTTTFLKVNPAFTTVLGYAQEDLVGVSFMQFLHPDDVEPTRKVVDEQLTRGDKVINFTNRYRRKDGEYVWLNWNSHPDPEKGVTYAVALDITEQRRYEQELKEREALLNEVGAIAKIGGWEMDLVTRQSKWTKGTYDIVEIEPGQPIPGPDDHVDWYLPKYRDMIKEAMRALVEDDVPLDFEAEAKTGKGKIKWCRALGRAERVNGKAVRVYGTFQDITERKQAEEELRESQLWLEATFSAQADAIFVVTPDRRTVRVNPAASDIFGYTTQELIEHSTEVVHVDHEHYLEFGRRLQEAFDRGEAAHFEFECKRKNGEIFPTEHTVSLLKSDGDQPMGILSVLRDITERKQAEEMLAQTQERFRQLMEQSPSVIEIYDAKGNQIQVNRAYEELWDFPASHTVGHFNLFKSQEFARLGLRPYAERAYAGEVVDIPPYRFDGRGPTEGRGRGRVRWLKTRFYPLKDNQGQVQNLVVTHEDYSETRNAEEHARALEAQLRQSQKLEAVGTLAGGIAHDFNNILAAIMGYAELTQDDLPAGHPSRDNVGHILSATRRARDLTRQVLNFSRPGEEHQRPMRLAVLVKETLKLLRPSIPAYIDIRQDISDEDVLIMADQSQMHQVLLNLCTNAAQAINENGFVEVGLKTIEVKAGQPDAPPNLKSGSYQMLWVKDSGQGMDQNTLGRVFDPFFTTKEPGAGTGMGLSVVHGIVLAHDGAVSVESRPGEGSLFQVYLPVLEDGELPHESQENSLPGGRERILLVDDEPALVDLGRKALERLGYQVTTATSSRDALELFRTDPQAFDLVITDYTMPGLTGTALAESMLQLRPGLPIILCTGYSSDHITSPQVRSLGIRSLAHKPLRSAEIARIIRRTLDRN
ncbi:MAG: PAS domain S-box protein [Desulfarculaceae bacterium]|nr:PAS domain S-box protein [Desulfarculaceae bacterium]MCF8070783.1 PAS domain S-box protein [Desulfarculaceae bacterium]MCF8102220.1 PAS domain S-box protein [Desulfarculaceae bacterium]MCF8116981.1 PAS domain S-box protein [Desulfarculaceae bacterium]